LKKIQETIETLPVEVKESSESKRSKSPENIPQAASSQVSAEPAKPPVVEEVKSEPKDSTVPIPKAKEGK
jgi:hypothetical protein